MASSNAPDDPIEILRLLDVEVSPEALDYVKESILKSPVWNGVSLELIGISSRSGSKVQAQEALGLVEMRSTPNDALLLRVEQAVKDKNLSVYDIFATLMTDLPNFIKPDYAELLAKDGLAEILKSYLNHPRGFLSYSIRSNIFIWSPRKA